MLVTFFFEISVEPSVIYKVLSTRYFGPALSPLHVLSQESIVVPFKEA